MNFDFHAPRKARENLDASLSKMVQAQLIRRDPEFPTAVTYAFKHALVQDTAYGGLMKHDRKQLHRLVAETLERELDETLDENSAELARHFELAEDKAHALRYLQRAAEWARRAAAHHEEADLLAHAIACAEPDTSADVLADLHTRRGKAFANLTRFREARAALLTALEFVSPTDATRRAQILNELAIVTQWLLDVSAATQYAREALALAEEAGRDDMAAQAMSSLAFAIVSDGDVRGGLEYYARAFERGGKDPSPALIQGMEISGLALYWIAAYAQAAARIRQAITRAREISDSFTVMRGLGNLGMVLGGQGDYGQALETFAAAREFGNKHSAAAFLARALSMEAGMHLELFDYARAQELALEARAIARATHFHATVTNAAIDLMIKYTRCGDLYLADQYVREVERVLPNASGSHRWLWEIRFAYARAELALARMQWQSTLDLANQALAQSRAHGRGKYQALALVTRAHAQSGLKDHSSAHASLLTALEFARADGSPSLYLRVAIPLYRHDKRSVLRDEIRSTAARIRASLPEGTLRACFEATISEWI